MVSPDQRLLIARRIFGPALFLLVAGLVWWKSAASGIFFLAGIGQPWTDWLGPLLPSLCAGLSVLLVLRIADSAIGYLSGFAAALALCLVPAFLQVHASSLRGPPLLIIFLLQFAVMLQAPRFSIAYGTVAAVAAVTVSSAALGLPIAAVLWPFLATGQPGTTRHSPRRAVLALIPLGLILILAHLTGVEWSPEAPQVAPGWMGRGLLYGLGVTADFLAPGLPQPLLRTALIVLMVSALLWSSVQAWLVRGRTAHPASVLRRVHPAALLLLICYGGGLVQRLMWSGGGALPDPEALLPLAAVIVLIYSINTTALWSTGSRLIRCALLLPAAIWLLVVMGFSFGGFAPTTP